MVRGIYLLQVNSVETTEKEMQTMSGQKFDEFARSYEAASAMSSRELAERMERLRDTDPELHALFSMQTLRIGLIGLRLDPQVLDAWARLRAGRFTDPFATNPSLASDLGLVKDDPVPLEHMFGVLRGFQSLLDDERYRKQLEAVVDNTPLPPQTKEELCRQLKRSIMWQWHENLKNGQLTEYPDVPCDSD